MRGSFTNSAAEVTRLMVGTDMYPGGVHDPQTKYAWKLAPQDFFDELSRKRNTGPKIAPVFLTFKVQGRSAGQPALKASLTPQQRLIETRRRPPTIAPMSDEITVEFNSDLRRCENRLFFLVNQNKKNEPYVGMVFRPGQGFLRLPTLSPANLTNGVIVTQYSEPDGFDKAWDLVHHPPTTPEGAPKQLETRKLRY